MHVILIPAYEPDARLPALVEALRATDPTTPVIVVDDGSGPVYAPVFARTERFGCVVLRHPRNRGKGAALKTGLRRILRDHPGAHVITADCDGQHTPRDIARVAARMERVEACRRVREPHTLVLGTRAFTGTVPVRSRFGNASMRAVFRAATGSAVHDTQTGLRGLPAARLDWFLTVPGDRFEYEFRMLLQARAADVRLLEEPIATVYTHGNRSSHFRPLSDSLRVSAPLVRFAASALFSFALDTIALLVLQALTGGLLLSVLGARLMSASANFAINRRLVFRRGRDVPVRAAAMRYFSLAALLLSANYGMLTALTDAGMPLLWAKLLTEAGLFAVSFSVQRAVVFAPGRTPDASAGVLDGEPAHVDGGDQLVRVVGHHHLVVAAPTPPVGAPGRSGEDVSAPR